MLKRQNTKKAQRDNETTFAVICTRPQPEKNVVFFREINICTIDENFREKFQPEPEKQSFVNKQNLNSLIENILCPSF